MLAIGNHLSMIDGLDENERILAMQAGSFTSLTTPALNSPGNEDLSTTGDHANVLQAVVGWPLLSCSGGGVQGVVLGEGHRGFRSI